MQREAEFEQLLEKAQDLFRDHPDSGWIIVIKTVSGNTYHAVSPPLEAMDFFEEDAMLRSMAENEDTQASRIVCLHSLSCVSVVSGNIRLKLRDMNAENMNAEVLLQGPEPGTYGYKTLRQLFPPSKEQVNKWIREGKIPDLGKNI